jgi:hypothetical protein
MPDVQWQRVGGSFGIVFVLLILFTAFGLAPNAPLSTASAKDVSAWVTAHRDALGVANYFGALATLFLVVFAAALRSRLARAESDRGQLANVSFGGSLVLVGLLLFAGAVEVALTQRGLDNRDVSVATLNLVAGAAGPILYFPLVLMVGAASGSALATGSLPRWLALLGWLVVLTGLIAGLAAAVRNGPLALDGVPVSLGLPIFLLWVSATSIVLLVRPAAGPATAVTLG